MSYIIKFPNGRYLAFNGNNRLMVKQPERAYTYGVLSVAESTLEYMVKRYEVMKGCVVVSKDEEINVHKMLDE